MCATNARRQCALAQHGCVNCVARAPGGGAKSLGIHPHDVERQAGAPTGRPTTCAAIGVRHTAKGVASTALRPTTTNGAHATLARHSRYSCKPGITRGNRDVSARRVALAALAAHAVDATGAISDRTRRRRMSNKQCAHVGARDHRRGNTAGAILAGATAPRPSLQDRAWGTCMVCAA